MSGHRLAVHEASTHLDNRPRSTQRLMARPRSGNLRVTRTARGDSYAARFTLHGREHFEFIGGEWDGWTEAQARAQMAVTMRQVNNGEWMPPARRSAAAPAAIAEEPTFQVLASLWLDRQRRRVADKTAGQYAWALAHLIDFFADDLPSELTQPESTTTSTLSSRSARQYSKLSVPARDLPRPGRRAVDARTTSAVDRSPTNPSTSRLMSWREC